MQEKSLTQHGLSTHYHAPDLDENVKSPWDMQNSLDQVEKPLSATEIVQLMKADVPFLLVSQSFAYLTTYNALIVSWFYFFCSIY